MKSVIDVEKDEDVKLNGLITVVNALKASKQMKAFGEFFNNQIEYATTVVLSRSQKATPEQLELCVKQIQALNPKAAVITTPWDEIKGEQILKVVEGQDSLEVKLLAEQHAKEEALEHEHEHHHDHDHEEHEHHHDHDHEEHEHHHDHDHDHEEHDENCTCGCHDHDHDHEEHEHHHDHDHDHEEHDENCTCGCHDHDHHHHHHADEVFTSWGKETPHKFTKEQIEEVLKTLCETDDYGSIKIRSGWNFSMTSCKFLPKSPTKEQQMHPEFISVISIPASFKNPPSMPTSPNSFSIRTIFSPLKTSSIIFLINVVFPAPRKPDIISIFVIVLSLPSQTLLFYSSFSSFANFCMDFMKLLYFTLYTSLLHSTLIYETASDTVFHTHRLFLTVPHAFLPPQCPPPSKPGFAVHF